MCNGICQRFRKRKLGKNHYCQKCARFIPVENLTRERKTNGRMRCGCCNGLVRNKTRVYVSA